MTESSTIPTKNKSFVLKEIENVVFEERPIPSDQDLPDDEVIVAPKKTGICGSDVHYVKRGRIGDFVVNKPMILGHESAGIIVKVGKKVTHLKPGDRVALEPGQVCRVCHDCKSGHYELCPHVVFAATPPYDGTLTGFYRIPGDLAYLLPDNVALEQGAMMEPLSVGVHAVYKVAEMRGNDNIVVFGAGPVGLLTMAAAKALGARRIIAVDINKDRLNFAKSYAATDIFLPPSRNGGEGPLEYATRATQEMKKALGIAERGPGALDVVFEATGAETCIQIGIMLSKPGGTFVQVGMGQETIAFPITTVITKGLIFKGSFRYGPGVYPLAIDLVSSGKIDLKPLITHRYTFKQADQAFKDAAVGKSDDGKALIKAIIDGPEDD